MSRQSILSCRAMKEWMVREEQTQAALQVHRSPKRLKGLGWKLDLHFVFLSGVSMAFFGGLSGSN
jgi:hypothetical protein